MILGPVSGRELAPQNLVCIKQGAVLPRQEVPDGLDQGRNGHELGGGNMKGAEEEESET